MGLQVRMLLVLIAAALLSAEVSAVETTCEVSFVNRGPGVTIRIDKGPWIPLARGRSTSVKVQSQRLSYVVARGTHWQYSAHLELANQRSRSIELIPPSAYLRVINRSEEDRSLRWGDRTLGVIKRRSERTWGPLHAAAKGLHSTGLRSGDIQRYRLRLRHGRSHSLILRPLASSLVVYNPSSEAARLRVGFHDYAMVKPRAHVAITGLAPGKHQVELTGIVSGRVTRMTGIVAVGDSESKSSTVATLTIVNQTGEKVRLVKALGRLLDRAVKVGEQVSFSVPARTFQLRMVGQDSQLIYRRDMKASEARPSWILKRPTGQLHLTNDTGENATAEVSGRAAFALPMGRSLTVRDVPAGAMYVTIQTRSGQRFRKGLVLPAGGDLTWRVSAGKTRLIVKNHYPESLILHLDGAPRGTISPGASFKLSGLRPGAHAVSVTSTFSKRRESAKVVLRDGKSTHLAFIPPKAAVRVTNPTQTNARVVVRGQVVGEVAAATSKAFAVVGGRLVVALRGPKPTQEIVWRGRLAPGQHLPMTINWSAKRRLEVSNSGVSEALVAVDTQQVVRIAPGAKHRFDGLALGEHLVLIRYQGVDRRQRIRIKAANPSVVLNVPSI